MTDEEYDKRRGTLRDWGRKQKEADPTFNLARHAREHRELVEVQRQVKLGYPVPEGYELDDKGKVRRVEKENVENAAGGGGPSSEASAAIAAEHGPQTVDGIIVGDRCEVQPGGRRGTVAYVGTVPEIGGGGHWVGVKFDEPVGRTDGTVKSGKRYFDAGGSNMGGFVRGKNCVTGDFPERDIFDELDSDLPLERHYLLGEVDGAHATLSELSEDGVRTDSLWIATAVAGIAAEYSVDGMDDCIWSHDRRIQFVAGGGMIAKKRCDFVANSLCYIGRIQERSAGAILDAEC